MDQFNLLNYLDWDKLKKERDEFNKIPKSKLKKDNETSDKKLKNKIKDIDEEIINLINKIEGQSHFLMKLSEKVDSLFSVYNNISDKLGLLVIIDAKINALDSNSNSNNHLMLNNLNNILSQLSSVPNELEYIKQINFEDEEEEIKTD